jgi:spore maturation protein CgeB
MGLGVLMPFWLGAAESSFLRLAGTAQICVDASTYLDGINDRVFSYAVNGAVCFTNAAGYLRALVGDDTGIQFDSMRSPHGMAENVCELLARPSQLAERSARGREMVLGAHTWRHRVEYILAAMK